ncbi:Replication factor A protein 1, partial [Kappamyces sp. JEL0680]
CPDAADVPQIQFNATPLANLSQTPADTIVDVVALVKESGDLVDLMSKNQKPVRAGDADAKLKKREVVLVDESGYQVRMTLWGSQAQDWTVDSGNVVGFKGVKVGEFGGGKTLSTGFDCIMVVNPDISEAHHLKGWWDNTGSSSTFQSLAGTGGPAGTRQDVYKTIAQVGEEGLGMDGKPAYFSLQAHVSHIKQENAWYAACPTEGCNKKVTEMDRGWRCEKCDMSFPAPKMRFILAFSVSDYTGQMWLQAFNDQAQLLLGCSADDMAAIKDTNPAAYEAVFANALGALVDFKVRAKVESYQDEQKLRCAAANLAFVDFSKAANDLVALIDAWN